MRFPPSFLDEIKARLPVSEVVRRRVKLLKAGREWKGLSPFGSEKTPSFFVNDQKMAWFDFSSGKNGNVFDFVMATEGLSFPETVERLAQEAGLPLPARSEDSERQERRRAGLHEILEWAAAFFEAQLHSERGTKARLYLDGRGIAPKSRTEFRIGYAPADRHALRDALAAKGATVEVMCEAGLLIHGEDIPVPYDRFRDRVMFPIADRGGRIIAFGGRALEKDVQAKYLNSPETPVFQKGRVLFNHHRARKAAHESSRVIAVEGYLDVVAMHAAGFGETVAPLGTALTEEQAGLLWAMSPEPILCFDGDKAGRKAAYRAADMALPLIGANRTFAFALLPEGQDPDDLIRIAGSAAIKAALAHAVPLIDILWNRETEGRILATPEHWRGLTAALHDLERSIQDNELRFFYHDAFRERIRARRLETKHSNARQGAEAQPRRFQKRDEERRGYLTQAKAHASASLAESSRFTTRGDWPSRETMILAILIAHPTLIAENAETLARLQFEAGELRSLRDQMLSLEQAEDSSPNSLFEGLAEAGFGDTLARIRKSDAASRWYARVEAPLPDAAEVLRQNLILHRQRHALEIDLLTAREALAEQPTDANLARLRDLCEQRDALAGKEATIEGFGQSSGHASASL